MGAFSWLMRSVGDVAVLYFAGAETVASINVSVLSDKSTHTAEIVFLWFAIGNLLDSRMQAPVCDFAFDVLYLNVFVVQTKVLLEVKHLS